MIRRPLAHVVPNIRRFAIALALATIALSGASQAAEPETEAAYVKYRQSVMSIIGTNMGAIGDIAKQRLELPGAVANHAGQMVESAALIAPAFKRKISQGETDAKAEIWQDWAKFEKAIATFKESARKLQVAAQNGDSAAAGEATMALGKACGGCHKPFRKPKEESFKNK